MQNDLVQQIVRDNVAGVCVYSKYFFIIKTNLLHYAIGCGSMNVAKYLVDYFDICEYDDDLLTPLDKSINNDDFLLFLIGRMDDILHKAIQTRNMKMIDKLISLGANPYARSQEGGSILHTAIVCSRKITMYLTNRYPELCTFKDNYGNTILHVASNYDMLHLLIGIFPTLVSVRNKNNEIPFDNDFRVSNVLLDIKIYGILGGLFPPEIRRIIYRYLRGDAYLPF